MVAFVYCKRVLLLMELGQLHLGQLQSLRGRLGTLASFQSSARDSERLNIGFE